MDHEREGGPKGKEHLQGAISPCRLVSDEEFAYIPTTWGISMVIDTETGESFG